MKWNPTQENFPHLWYRRKWFFLKVAFTAFIGSSIRCTTYVFKAQYLFIFLWFLFILVNIIVMSKWARGHLKSPATHLFTQPLVQAQIKEKIKTPRHWPLWGETTGDRWFPSQRANNAVMFPFHDVNKCLFCSLWRGDTYTPRKFTWAIRAIFSDILVKIHFFTNWFFFYKNAFKNPFERGPCCSKLSLMGHTFSLVRQIVLFIHFSFVLQQLYICGLVQDCSNSSDNAMELPQSCTKPSICAHLNLFWSGTSQNLHHVPLLARGDRGCSGDEEGQ